MRNSSYRLALLVALICGGTATAQTSSQTWSKKAPFPEGQSDAAVSFVIDSKIYIGGGTGGKRLYEYDPATSAWTRKADIPGVTTSRGFGIGFSIGTKGYVGLGVDANGSLHDLWEYDPTTDKWTRKADFPGPANDGLASFVIGSKAYVGGGTDNTYVYGYLYEYDPAADTWTQKGDMPMGPVVFASEFTIGQYAYLTNGAGNTELTSLYRYDASNDSWEQKADFPGAPRQCGIGFAVDGKGYAGLGQTGYASVFNDIYSYDPVADKWDTAGEFPSGRAWTTASVVGGTVYIGTGWDLASNFYDDWWGMSLSSPAAGIVSPAASSSGFSVYPNPVGNNLRVEATSRGPILQIVLVDAVGGEVLRQQPDGDRYSSTVDLSHLSSGLYMVRVESRDGVSTFKVIKE